MKDEHAVALVAALCQHAAAVTPDVPGLSNNDAVDRAYDLLAVVQARAAQAETRPPMPAKRMVEVESRMGDGWVPKILRPDSLEAAMLTLAEAADRWEKTGEDTDEDEAAAAWDNYLIALNAVRSHPDYRRST